MNSFLVLCLLLSVVYTITANIDGGNTENEMSNSLVSDVFALDIREIGEGNRGLIREEISMNYRDNYVRVTTPSLILIHDYSVGMTLFKKTDGRCLLLNEYRDMPEHLDDWLKLERDANDNVLEYDTSDMTLHLYKKVRVGIDRTTLPQVMQDECEGSIDLAVLSETVKGAEALAREESKTRGYVYLPSVCNNQKGDGKSRQKRSWVLCLFCVRCGIEEKKDEKKDAISA